MKMKLLIATVAAAAGLAGAAAASPLDPVAGAPGGHSPVKVLVVVSARGLDLTNYADADRFLVRLNAAVNQACDDRPSVGPPLTLARSAEFQACRSQALAAAMAYVPSPIVKRRYAAMEGKGGIRLAQRR